MNVTEMFMDIGELAKNKLESNAKKENPSSEIGTTRNLITEDGTIKNKKACC